MFQKKLEVGKIYYCSYADGHLDWHEEMVMQVEEIKGKMVRAYVFASITQFEGNSGPVVNIERDYSFHKPIKTEKFVPVEKINKSTIFSLIFWGK